MEGQDGMMMMMLTGLDVTGLDMLGTAGGEGEAVRGGHMGCSAHLCGEHRRGQAFPTRTDPNFYLPLLDCFGWDVLSMTPPESPIMTAGLPTSTAAMSPAPHLPLPTPPCSPPRQQFQPLSPLPEAEFAESFLNTFSCTHGSSCFCSCPFKDCDQVFTHPEAFVQHICDKGHRRDLKDRLQRFGCLFPGCSNRRSVWKKCYVMEHLLVSHFQFKRFECPDCGERFSQKKNLYGKEGHCTKRICRQCQQTMTCLTKHRAACPCVVDTGLLPLSPTSSDSS